MSVIISIRGPKGSGKSSLAKRLRGKNGWLDLEFGSERAYSEDTIDNDEVWQPLENGLDEVLFEVLTLEKGGQVTRRRDLWEAVVHQYGKFLRDPNIDNIIVDTAKELWYMNYMFHLQHTQEEAVRTKKRPRQNLQPIEYATPNNRMNAFVYAARAFHKNLILIAHDRPIYVEKLIDGELREVPSGEYELDGYKNTLDLVDWAFISRVDLRCQKRIDNPSDHECKGYHFYATIEKSPNKINLVGAEIEESSARELITPIGEVAIA